MDSIVAPLCLLILYQIRSIFFSLPDVFVGSIKQDFWIDPQSL